MNDNDGWLSLTTQGSLDPTLPICDPYHHLWVQRAGAIPQYYLLDHFLADVYSGHNVVSTAFIEVRYDVQYGWSNSVLAYR